MITGKQPFVADTAMAIIVAALQRPAPAAPRTAPGLPAGAGERRPPDAGKTAGQALAEIEDANAAIGATPLSHDDPIRLQMVGARQTSLNQRLLDEMKTPTSLVPPTRSSGKQGTEAIPAVGSVGVSPRSVNLSAGETIPAHRGRAGYRWVTRWRAAR
jgi:hypothetical protein